MSNAERQRRYRQARKKPDGPTEERLTVMLDHHAALALRRLARHYGATQKATLEELLTMQQDAETTGMTGPELDCYYRDFD